mmetsp:Transcript_11323/g.48894  ORF Transcript_11323/g.48894 Transcript_11323/m.48894 type:complete len:283 (+) Transcript_11323:755-1603(+)
MSLVPIRAAGRDDVPGLAPPDLNRVLQGLPPAPLPHRQRVPRGRHRAVAEIVADPRNVAVDPAETVLPRREHEGVGSVHERLGDDVELAHGARVRAPVGEVHHASVDSVPIRARAVVEELRAFPDPALPLEGSEGVDVEHGLPGGLRGLEVVHGGAAPDALDVVLVLPEVVHEVAAQAHVGDLPLVVVDGAQLGEHRVVLGFAGGPGDRGERALVLRLDPLHAPLAPQVLEEHVVGGVARRHGGDEGASIGADAGENPRATGRGERRASRSRGRARAVRREG